MSTDTKKKSPNLDLRGAVGNYVIGTLQGRFESKNYPDKYSVLIKVEETTGNTTIGFKADKKEVDIEPGDSVFLAESSWLASIFENMPKGTRFKLVYTGDVAATKKGYKPSITYTHEVL